jgi:hypothetical protein
MFKQGSWASPSKETRETRHLRLIFFTGKGHFFRVVIGLSLEVGAWNLDFRFRV